MVRLHLPGPPPARLALGLLLAGVLAAGVPAAPLAAAPRPHWCECVEYVKNYYGLHGAAGNAKDMGPFLAAHGFRRTEAPAVGAVVIIQPGFYSRGSGAVYGHVAIIESLAPAGKRGWFLGLRSANQTGKQFAAAECSNVTFESIGPVAHSSRMFSYWLPPR